MTTDKKDIRLLQKAFQLLNEARRLHASNEHGQCLLNAIEDAMHLLRGVAGKDFRFSDLSRVE